LEGSNSMINCFCCWLVEESWLKILKMEKRKKVFPSLLIDSTEEKKEDEQCVEGFRYGLRTVLSSVCVAVGSGCSRLRVVVL